LVKIGIIISNKHKKHRLKALIKYLKQKAEVSIYREDNYLLQSSPRHYFNEDLFFIKGKGNLILSLVKCIEKETSIPTINSFKGIWLAMNRFLNSVYLRKAGILVPDYTLIPEQMKAPFKNFIIKNIIDQKSSTFKPKIQFISGNLHVSDERAVLEAQGSQRFYHYYFYQRFIKSKWEYKVYGIGDQLFYFKQVPTIKNPHRVKPKMEIDKIPELEELVLKAKDALSLKIASIDFLKSKDGLYYLTDINSGPNINTIENGPKIVGDFLLEQIKK